MTYNHNGMNHVYNFACTQCGQTDDLLSMLTEHNTCGKCTRKNHRKATGKTSQ